MTWYWIVAFGWACATIGLLAGYIIRRGFEPRVALALFTPQNLPAFNPLLQCPECGHAPETGHGFAGGRLGPYSFCPSCLVVISKSSHAEWYAQNPDVPTERRMH